jgi:hypothetical protein
MAEREHDMVACTTGISGAPTSRLALYARDMAARTVHRAASTASTRMATESAVLASFCLN